MKNNLLTVNVITYNHKPYIAKCLDSLLEQETDFGFIIRVFDDCSTDGTTEICREYAEKNPNKIFFYPTEKNLGVIENPIRAYSNIETPYYMLIEGDDYSCGQGRFQRQVKILEEHPECSFCAAKTMTNFVHGESRNGDFPVLQTGIYSLEWLHENYTTNIMPHSGTRIVRTECIHIDSEHPNVYLNDVTQLMMLLQKGSLYFIDEVFCVYNYTGDGIWSGRDTFGKIQFILNNLSECSAYTSNSMDDILLNVFLRDVSYNVNFFMSTHFKKNIPPPVLMQHKSKRRLKAIKRFIQLFIPPILLKIIHLPRDVIRFIKSRRKQ